MRTSHHLGMKAPVTLGLLSVLLLAGSTVQAQLSGSACGPFVESSEELLNGDFLLGISYFGALTIGPLGDIEGDLDFFKSRGIN